MGTKMGKEKDYSRSLIYKGLQKLTMKCRGIASGGCGGVTPPTFGIFVGKFNSYEFRRYMADVLSHDVLKSVEIALSSINTCGTVRCISAI